MPQVGSWLVAVWTGASAAGQVGAFLLKTAASMVLNAAVSKLTASKGARPGEVTTELRSSNARRIRHLGRVRASGAVMFWDWAHVGNKRRLFKLIAVSDGGLQDVHQWYLDGAPVDVDASGYVTTEPWNKGNIRLRFRRGIQGDQWDGGNWVELRDAFPDQWTTDHRLRGIGTILATFDAVGEKDIGEVYSGGEPEVSALISGSPQFRPADSTYSQTRNAAVMLGDVLTHPVFGGLDPQDIDLDELATATSDCGALVPSPDGDRIRYGAGLSYAMSDAMKNTAQTLLDAMGGRATITPAGKMAIRAGVWRAPSVTIEERHIVEMEYGAGTSRISRTTTLVPTYVAPQVHWQETSADPVEDTDAIARWGEGEPKSTDLLAVQHHGQARHVCKILLPLLNPARRMSLTLRSSGLRLLGEVNAFVNLPRLGLANVPFWIESWAWDGTNVRVDLIEAEPASMVHSGSDEGQPPPTPEPIDRGTADREIVIDGVSVVTNDGPPYITVKGSLNAQAGDNLLAQYKRSSGGAWVDMFSEAGTGSDFGFRTAPLADLSDYDVRVFIGYYSNGSGGRELRIQSTPIVVSGIEVVVNSSPPADPVLVSESGVSGGTLTATFMPDLGANYRRTGLYRAGASGNFASATIVKWSYDTSTDVTITAPIPAAGARFWLQSENPSERKSNPVLVGTYPA